MQVRSLGRVDPLEEGTTTHASVLAWRIPWTEEPGRLQSTGSQRVRPNWSNWTHTHSTHIDIFNIFSYLIKFQKFHCCYSFAKLCPTLCDPMDCSTPGFPVLHYLQEFAQTHSIKSVIPSNHLILCRPLLLLTSIFPSIRVFSNESALCIRLSKYWSFSIRSI